MIDDFIKLWEIELRYFKAPKYVELAMPIALPAISWAEQQLNVKLSPQMIDFFTRHNGARIVEIRLYGIEKDNPSVQSEGMGIVWKNSFRRGLPGWQSKWLEVGRDGFGNYFVADLTRKNPEGEYPILIVDHEDVGRPNATSEYADSYFDFIHKATKEMMAIYQPDGEFKADHDSPIE